MDNIAILYENLVDEGLKFLPFWNLIYNSNNLINDDHKLLHHLYDPFHFPPLLRDHNEQYKHEIISAIENWLKPNSMDILMDNFYVKFVAFVCLIGCSSLQLQRTKTPWSYVSMAIEKLDDERVRSHFIKDFEALYQKHYGSKEFYVKLADLVVANAG